MSTVRTLAFRVLAVLFALLLLVGFGAWRGIFSPWWVAPDQTDHGWPRTPELHRVADTSAALLFIMIGIALVVLAIGPRGRSGLSAWTGAVLALTGGLAWVSALIQGHDIQPALVTSLVWLALVALMFLVLHPERALVRRGGARQEVGPDDRTRLGLTVAGAVGVVLALGAVGWRLSGGVFESPFEDDVLSLTYLGLAWALAAGTARAGRAGWRALALIVAFSMLYAVLALVFLLA